MLLARSGDSAPINININMDGYFMHNISSYEECPKRARDALEFIVAHGGVTSRWETLTVCSDSPEAILAVMDFVYNTCLDNLCTLVLIMEERKLDGDDLVAEVLSGQASSESVMFKTQPPLLHSIQLAGIPPSFLFQRGPIPPVCNLTVLHITKVNCMPHLVGLRELFIHSPRLEILSLYSWDIENLDFQYQPPETIRVYMPHLRQFTHHQWDSVSWGLSILKMVDAPNVEMFSLNMGSIEDSDAILFYLTFGRRGERLIDNHSGLSKHVEGASIYPTLKHLIIDRTPDSYETLSGVLKAFQSITRLDWKLRLDSDEHLVRVLNNSTTCPQLEHLRVYHVPKELITMVRQRAEQGRPLKVVEANSYRWDKIPISTRRELRGMLERFEPYGDLKYCSYPSEDDDINESTGGDNCEDNCPPDRPVHDGGSAEGH
ncbi:hypothetical protein BDV93DRAFT_341885 [Ceratobasidium sp. AG-I]|nr:hypothetical protein BDV93DRAFT_341885 [Ceratobasidium sp. AG-I]